MKKCVLALGVLVLLVIGCDDRDDNLNAANIRIHNRSNISFNSVQVNDSVIYENVGGDGFSDYKAYITAFEFDDITILTNTAQFTFAPDSITPPLPLGLYTYELNISEQGEVLFNFKVD
ncbi:MAG: hypothetical protein AAGB24_11565 [Bacteroidota bacterium]